MVGPKSQTAMVLANRGTEVGDPDGPISINRQASSKVTEVQVSIVREAGPSGVSPAAYPAVITAEVELVYGRKQPTEDEDVPATEIDLREPKDRVVVLSTM